MWFDAFKSCEWSSVEKIKKEMPETQWENPIIEWEKFDLRAMENKDEAKVLGKKIYALTWDSHLLSPEEFDFRRSTVLKVIQKFWVDRFNEVVTKLAELNKFNSSLNSIDSLIWPLNWLSADYNKKRDFNTKNFIWLFESGGIEKYEQYVNNMREKWYTKHVPMSYSLDKLQYLNCDEEEIPAMILIEELWFALFPIVDHFWRENFYEMTPKEQIKSIKLAHSVWDIELKPMVKEVLWLE